MPAVVHAPALAAFVTQIFMAKGLSDSHAAQVSDVLVWANLRGVDTHGVGRVPLYLGWIEHGVINRHAAPKVRKETPAAGILDADRAAGPVAMMLAAEGAVEKARRAGLGAVLVARTTHTAALGFYARHVTSHGCVCIALSASGPNMAYHGTKDAAVSTSPLCIGVPSSNGGALVLDMATSVVSLGRLVLARRTGEALAPGWAIDREGRPTTDAREAVLPLPMAGPKGAGLSLMAELITGLLTRDPILHKALSEGDTRHRQNAMIIAIDIASFTDLAAFQDGVAALAAVIGAMPRQPGFDAILMPGERGDRVHDRRMRDGIPISGAIWADLVAAADALGVAVPAPSS